MSSRITGPNFVRTAGEAGQAAWRAPGASAAGIVRSGFRACRGVRRRGDRNELFFRTGCHRRRGRGSSGSPAPLRGRDVRGVGDRNGSFAGGRRHRREQGTADLPGGSLRAGRTLRPGARPAGGGSGADGHDVYHQCWAGGCYLFNHRSRHGVHHGRQHRGI